MSQGLWVRKLPELFAAEVAPAEDPALVEQSRAALYVLFHDNAIDISQIRHAAVDVQRDFCDAVQAAHITRDIAPRLKAAGIDTDWIYYNRNDLGPEKSCGGLYKNEIPAGDSIVPKPYPSAFTATGYDDTLAQAKKKILLVSGFEYACCVKATILDACRNGYQVILLKDATDFRAKAIFPSNHAARKALDAELVAAGAIIVDSGEVFEQLDALKEKAPVQRPALVHN